MDHLMLNAICVDASSINSTISGIVSLGQGSLIDVSLIKSGCISNRTNCTLN